MQHKFDKFSKKIPAADKRPTGIKLKKLKSKNTTNAVIAIVLLAVMHTAIRRSDPPYHVIIMLR